MMGVNINGSAPGTGTAGRQLYPYVTSDMNMYEPFGSMTYDGLQMRMRKRIGASLFDANYTFSKAIDKANGDNGDATLWRAYPVSYRLNKQLSGINRAQTLTIAYVYMLPFGKGHRYANRGIADYVIGGWQLSSIISRFSGLPFTLGTTSAINAGGQGTSASQVNPSVAILGGHNSSFPYFDGTAFTNPPAGVLGSTGRNLLIGPGFFQMNASVSKQFLFKEGKLKFQLVGEAFNLTNTPVFNNPGGSCCWTTNANGTPNYNGFGIITGTANPDGPGPRYLQVGGYLRF